MSNIGVYYVSLKIVYVTEISRNNSVGKYFRSVRNRNNNIPKLTSLTLSVYPYVYLNYFVYLNSNRG